MAPTVVLGDNVAALQLALDLKGKDGQASLAQALAVLVVSRTLHLTVGHLPSEANEAADSLSRQAEPGNCKPWPFGPEVTRDTPLPVAVLRGLDQLTWLDGWLLSDHLHPTPTRRHFH